MTNEERAARAAACVSGYSTVDGQPDASDIGDLMCDLMHAAEAAGMDPLSVVRVAIAGYLAEKRDPPHGWQVVVDVALHVRER
jgi:hypothetical protein